MHDENDDEDHIDVLNNDRSYMLSYIISKQKEEEVAPTNLKRTSERIRTQFLSKLVYQKVWDSPNQRPRTH
jgi:hypothetical protein